MTRIHIIGSGGAGKTVLASRLASALQVPHIELDSLFWGENWQPTETEVFQQVVGEALAGEDWVTDGNYSKVRQIIW
ncbi:MAG TPA: adenylate kinase, partial [Chloroflexi bacterium]|nr:adenylate kinase [Chloroflexota bacterium]